MTRKATETMFAIALLIMLSDKCFAQDGKISPKPGGAKVSNAIREPVHTLFEWPSTATIKAKRLNDPPIVKGYTSEFNYWLGKVMAPAWLPPNDTEVILLEKEFDGRDVMRMRWSKKDYDIQVSQTGSIFTIKLTPENGQGTGKSDKEKLDVARELCLQVFVKQGLYVSGQGKHIHIKDLPQKIAACSFSEKTTKPLKGDKGVLAGRPKTMEEEGIKTPLTIRDEPDSPNWFNIPFAWATWFRKVYWWNDGTSVGIHFLKSEGGDSVERTYTGELDRSVFHRKNQK